MPRHPGLSHALCKSLLFSFEGLALIEPILKGTQKATQAVAFLFFPSAVFAAFSQTPVVLASRRPRAVRHIASYGPRCALEALFAPCGRVALW